MALVHDVIPPFQLFQPGSVDDALDLLDARGAEAWVHRRRHGLVRLAQGPHRSGPAPSSS